MKETYDESLMILSLIFVFTYKKSASWSGVVWFYYYFVLALIIIKLSTIDLSINNFLNMSRNIMAIKVTKEKVQ